jgi:streptomycin 6-kinase
MLSIGYSPPMETAVSTYLRAWNLSCPVNIASTPTSEVYRVQSPSGPAVLKVLTPKGPEEQKGACALEYFQGIGAVRLIRFDKGAHLLEDAGEENLAYLVSQNRDEEATRIAADVLDRLHQTRTNVPPTDLWPLEQWFHALFFRVGQKECPEDFRDAASIAKELLANPNRIGVLHGDIHHENILLSPSRGWLAIDPKGLWGEATFDAANLFYNPMHSAIRKDKGRIETTARILSERLGLKYERILRFAFVYGYLSAAWTVEDGLGDPTPTLEIARQIRLLL